MKEKRTDMLLNQEEQLLERQMKLSSTITLEQLINAIKMSTETMAVIVPDDDHQSYFPSDFSGCTVSRIKFINPTSLIEALCG